MTSLSGLFIPSELSSEIIRRLFVLHDVSIWIAIRRITSGDLEETSVWLSPGTVFVFHSSTKHPEWIYGSYFEHVTCVFCCCGFTLMHRHGRAWHTSWPLQRPSPTTFPLVSMLPPHLWSQYFLPPATSLILPPLSSPGQFTHQQPVIQSSASLTAFPLNQRVSCSSTTNTSISCRQWANELHCSVEELLSSSRCTHVYQWLILDTKKSQRALIWPPLLGAHWELRGFLKIFEFQDDVDGFRVKSIHFLVSLLSFSGV